MSLHYVDPDRPHSRRYRALMGFGRSRPGQFFARHVSFQADPWLYRATGGRAQMAITSQMIYARTSMQMLQNQLNALAAADKVEKEESA